MQKLDQFQIQTLNTYITKKSKYTIPYTVKDKMIKFDVVPLNITIMINLSKMAKSKKLTINNIIKCIDDVIDIIETKPEINTLIRYELESTMYLAHYPYLYWNLRLRTEPQKLRDRYFNSKW